MMPFGVNYSCLDRAFKAGRPWIRLGLALASLSFPLVSALADIPTRDDARLQPSTQSSNDTASTATSSKARSQSAGGVKCSVTRKDMIDVLNQAADKHGLPRQYMENAAAVESRCNPNAGASNSSAKGLGQFIDGTWKQYGGGKSVYDPEANADAMARLTKDDVTQLQRKIGHSPTFEEAYLAHQQGIGGASCLLKNPSAPATNCVSPQAVTGNGGSLTMTGGQFAALVEGYYNSGSLAGARSAVANYNATGAMPNSGNFADGANGTAPTSPGDFPPLKTTPTRTASLSDQEKTSSAAVGYSKDLTATQSENFELLRQRSAAIGRTDRVQDSVDVNSRLRADQIQLRQQAIDTTNTWGSLITSSLIQDVTRQSQAAIAMTTAGGPTRGRSGDIMPGIPSPTASVGGCSVTAGTAGTCSVRVSDNALNVSTYLAHFASSLAPITPAQASSPSPGNRGSGAPGSENAPIGPARTNQADDR